MFYVINDFNYLVQLLDNREGKGAGMVLYLNSFCAKKMQQAIDPNGNGFFNEEVKDGCWIIFMDILNSDHSYLANIKYMLDRAGEFHKQYFIAMEIKKGNNPGNNDAELCGVFASTFYLRLCIVNNFKA